MTAWSPGTSLSVGWLVCWAALRFLGSQSVIQLSECMMCSKLLLLQKTLWDVRATIKLRCKTMQELLMQDMQRTLQKLDAPDSEFFKDNSAQVPQLQDQQQDTVQLRSSVPMALNKTEDLNFMKVPGLTTSNLTLPCRTSPPCMWTGTGQIPS